MTKPSSTNNMSFYGIDVRYYTAIQAMRELIGLGFYRNRAENPHPCDRG